MKRDRTYLLQNRFSGRDGRSLVASEIVYLLNKKGIRPILIGASHGRDMADFSAGFRRGIAFDYIKVPDIPIRRASAYKYPLFHLLARSHLNDARIVITSGSCPHYLPDGPGYFHYVHFPAEVALTTHEKFRNPAMRAYSLPLLALYGMTNRLTPAKKRRRVLYAGNSRFCAQALSKTYHIDRERVHILYPPCETALRKTGEKRQACISVGAVIDEKRQLEQIEIASRLPEIQFNIVGNAALSPGYFQRCQDSVRRLGLKNVRFHSGVDRTRLKQMYAESAFFIHSKRWEHFGIAVVEAIAHGCVPVVHDSGGPAEIVFLKELRYRSASDAVATLGALAGNRSRQTDMVDQLQKGLSRFGAEPFEQAFYAILSKIG